MSSSTSPKYDILDRPANPIAMFILMAALVPVLGPHVSHLPWWCSAMAGLLFAWRLLLVWKSQREPTPFPSTWILFILLILAFGATLYEHRTILGRDSGVTFVTLLLSLKLLETKTRRDIVVSIFLSYFLILTNFFYSQSIGTASLMLGALILITTALIAAHRDASHPPTWKMIKQAGIIIIQAFPMMLLLFLLFPRINGPLWGLPQDSARGVTGLSDSMSPGLISELGLSDEIAFRVEFKGTPPPVSRLYWRGPVLSQFDGRNWRIDRTLSELPTPTITPQGSTLAYSITLEPNNQPWLLGLEMPSALPHFARLNGELQPISNRKLTERIRYDVESHTNFQFGEKATEKELAPYLALPKGSNPRTRVMSATWMLESQNSEAIVQRGLQYFRTENFTYTLEPPLLDNHAVDQFLFDSRRGFCEHYASAFVVLMRASGIPARVVTGYQGGEINSVDGVFTVRQSDAHAWAEVWLRGIGWRRVDPTNAVSPNRIELGMQQALPSRFNTTLLGRAGNALDIDWLRKAKFQWEAIGNRWNQLVLNYTPDRQRETLERLGMKKPTWENMVLALVVGLIILGVILAYWVSRHRRSIDPIQKAWQKFCIRLAKQGVEKYPHEGPLDYIERALKHLNKSTDPSYAQGLRTIAQLYADLRYGKHASNNGLPATETIRNFISLTQHHPI